MEHARAVIAPYGHLAGKAAIGPLRGRTNAVPIPLTVRHFQSAFSDLTGFARFRRIAVGCRNAGIRFGAWLGRDGLARSLVQFRSVRHGSETRPCGSSSRPASPAATSTRPTSSEHPRRPPDVEFAGFGGPKMPEAGASCSSPGRPGDDVVSHGFLNILKFIGLTSAPTATSATRSPAP